jgi:hypothetical protein
MLIAIFVAMGFSLATAWRCDFGARGSPARGSPDAEAAPVGAAVALGAPDVLT